MTEKIEQNHLPQLSNGQFVDQGGVKDEGKSGTISGHLVNGLVELVGHVTNDSKDSQTSKDGGHAVKDGYQDSITGESYWEQRSERLVVRVLSHQHWKFAFFSFFWLLIFSFFSTFWWLR